MLTLGGEKEKRAALTFDPLRDIDWQLSFFLNLVCIDPTNPTKIFDFEPLPQTITIEKNELVLKHFCVHWDSGREICR